MCIFGDRKKTTFTTLHLFIVYLAKIHMPALEKHCVHFKEGQIKASMFLDKYSCNKITTTQIQISRQN